MLEALSFHIDTQLLQDEALLQAVSRCGTQWERISDFHEPKRTGDAIRKRYNFLCRKATEHGSPEEVSSEGDPVASPLSSRTSPKQSTSIEVGSLDGYQQQNYVLLPSSTISNSDGHAQYKAPTPGWTTPQSEADTESSMEPVAKSCGYDRLSASVQASGALSGRLTVVRPGRTYSNPSDRGLLQAIDAEALAKGNIATSGVSALCRSIIEQFRFKMSADYYGVGDYSQETFKSALLECASRDDALYLALAAFTSYCLNEQNENGQDIFLGLYSESCTLIAQREPGKLFTKETLFAILQLATIEVGSPMSIVYAL